MSEKLVRDLIPEIIRSEGKVPPGYRYVDRYDSEFVKLLFEKAREACLELEDARDDLTRRLDELADLSEVLLAVCEALDVTPDDVENRRRYRAQTRGAFTLGVVMKCKDKQK